MTLISKNFQNQRYFLLIRNIELKFNFYPCLIKLSTTKRISSLGRFFFCSQLTPASVRPLAQAASELAKLCSCPFHFQGKNPFNSYEKWNAESPLNDDSCPWVSGRALLSVCPWVKWILYSRGCSAWLKSVGRRGGGHWRFRTLI